MNRERAAQVMNITGSSILCVIDFSDASRDALKAAISIAASTGSRLTVLYPYRLNQPRNVLSPAEWKKSIDSDATNTFTRMTNALFKESDVTWEFKPEVGFIADRVDAYTQKHKVGLVIMSTTLIHSQKESSLDVLDKLKCPLLIIPDK